MTGAGASRGQFLSGVMVGATHKIWQTAGDSHVRDKHARVNGEVVGINERFSNGGLYPVDSRLSAGQRINCRCSMMFKISDMAKYNPDALEQGPNIQKYNETLTDIEKSISKEAIEHGYVIDKDGNVILTKTGDANKIGFTKDEVKKMKDNILTHNHPGEDISFSLEDVMIVSKAKLKEIRAVTPNGKIYKLSYELPEDMTEKQFELLAIRYKNAMARDMSAEIKNGDITVNEANLTLWDRVWQKVADSNEWFHYEVGGL